MRSAIDGPVRFPARNALHRRLTISGCRDAGCWSRVKASSSTCVVRARFVFPCTRSHIPTHTALICSRSRPARALATLKTYYVAQHLFYTSITHPLIYRSSGLMSCKLCAPHGRLTQCTGVPAGNALRAFFNCSTAFNINNFIVFLVLLSKLIPMTRLF